MAEGPQTNNGTILRIHNKDFTEDAAEAFIKGFAPSLKKVLYAYGSGPKVPLMRPGFESVEVWLPWVNETQRRDSEVSIAAIGMSLYHGFIEMVKNDRLPEESETYSFDVDREVEWEAVEAPESPISP